MGPNSKDTCYTSLIEIPLGSSRSGPSKRLYADLSAMAIEADRARNAMARAWLRWREDRPDWVPPFATDDDGNVKQDRDGNPIYINPMHPTSVLRDGTPVDFDDEEGISFRTYLYHVGCKTSPKLATAIISGAAAEVLSNLKTDVQHHKNGYKYRWQAILANVEQMPTFRMRNIVVANNQSCFCYDGKSTNSEKKDVNYWGKSGAVIQFPLYSQASGRDIKAPIVNVNIGALSPGHRSILKRVASGELKWCDSKLVCKKRRMSVKKNGKSRTVEKDVWQIQFTYKRPSENLGLNVNRVAELWPTLPTERSPFHISCADTSRHWYCGNGRLLAKEFERLNARRIAMRNKHKFASSSRKGHGKDNVEMRIRPVSQQIVNIKSPFTWKLIDEIVRFCKANDCGKVIYYEPILPVRSELWLAKNGVQYDWTLLKNNLSRKLKHFGIEFNDKNMVGKTAIADRKVIGNQVSSAKKKPSRKLAVSK